MQSLHPVDLPTLEQVLECKPLTVLPDTLIIDVIALMNSRKNSTGASISDCSSCVLVVEENKLVGIFTLRDVVRLTGAAVDLSRVKIAEVMTQPVISLTLAAAENALTALSFMRQHRIRHLPVVDEQGQLLGLISQDKIRQVLQPTHLLKLRCVTEVMETAVVHALPTTSVWELSQMMSDRRISCVVIVAPEETTLVPVGMISEKDILKVQLQGLDIAHTQAQALMSSPVLTISPTASLWTVHQLMAERGVRRLAVVGEQGELQGVVTQTNLLQVLDPIEIVNVIQVLQAKVAEQTVQLTQTNQQLAQEVRQRRQVEESLRQAQQELELRVAKRTAELLQANARLQAEIEERKQMATALQQREHQWQALFDHALDAIMIVDDEGRYIDANPAACELLGLSREELLGRRILDFAETRFDFTEVWQQFCEQGQMLGECKLSRPDGTVREAEFAAVANFLPHRHLSILRDITERRQAQTVIQEMSTDLHILHNLVPCGYHSVDAEGRFIDINDTELTMLGYSRAEVIGRKFSDFLTPESIPTFEENFPRFQQTGLVKDLEFQFICKDGSILPVSVTATAIKDPAGNYLMSRSIMVDISERKQAEMALKQSEQRLQAIIDNSPSIIYVKDMQGRHILVNSAFERVTQLTRKQAKNKTNWEIFSSDIAQTFTINDQKVLSSGTPLQFEEVLEFDDQLQTFLTVKFPLLDTAGKPYAVCGISTDITERKQTQQKIQQQAALIDVATDAVFVRDLDNHILFWSRGAENLYGWTAEESLGKKVDELFYRGSLSQLEAGLTATIAQGSWLGELEQITKTGREIIVASRWTLVRDESGKPQSILVVNTDITEKKQLEQQFYRTQRLESVGTLASGIAHDLNNVFAPMMMIAQLLPLRCKNVDGRTQELFQTLENNCKRGANLVKQILTFARGTEGKHILLQPGHLLKELVKVIQQTFPKSIEIVADIPTSRLGMVQADPTQLDQVFMNLAVNARDAMPNGGRLTITAENRVIDETYARMHLEAHPGGYIVVTICDTGTGIPPEFLERIFDPFFTTKEVGKGTGLGLSTVLGIVKNHGGFVEVSSQVGKGSQFQVFLPIAAGTATEAMIKTDLPRGNGELILVVDDEEVVKQTTQETLADYNYKTLVANDGIEAIALYVEYHSEISAVLLDMLMPNMDGLTAIRTLRTLNPNVKVIATSGLPTKQQKAMAAGANQFLAKPYTATDLLQTLSDVIGSGE